MHKENIISSDTFEKYWLNFSIAETRNADFPWSAIDRLGNLGSKVFRASSGEDFTRWANALHKNGLNDAKITKLSTPWGHKIDGKSNVKK